MGDSSDILPVFFGKTDFFHSLLMADFPIGVFWEKKSGIKKTRVGKFWILLFLTCLIVESVVYFTFFIVYITPYNPLLYFTKNYYN
jgi:hypothetical protein